MIVPDKLKALIVDDNAYARVLAAASLGKLGITTVVEAESGAAAVGHLLTQSFDFLLLDWYMPDVTGAGLIQILRDPRFGKATATPVIVMTAYPTRETVSKARELGIANILAKPFTAPQLAAALGRALPDVWGEVEGKKAGGADQFFL